MTGVGVRPTSPPARALILLFAAATSLASFALPAPAWAGQAGREAALDRLAQVARLEDARDYGGGELAARLLDPVHEVRRHAARALGRVGRPESAAPLVAALASDEAGVVRATAAFALGILEDPLPDEAVTALELALDDPSGRVRERAIQALGRRGGARAPEIIRRRLEVLVAEPGYGDRREDVESAARRTSWDEARLALFALARIADDGGEVGDVAGLFLDGGAPRTGWWAAAWAGARLRNPALFPLYAAHARSEDPVARAFGVRGLGAVPGAFASEFVSHLRHPADAVRIEALRAVGGPAAPEDRGAGIGAAVRDLLSDPAPGVRSEAVAALSLVRHPDAASDLLDLVLSERPDIRAGAYRALHRQDPSGFRLLLAGWSDSEPEGRFRLAGALASSADPAARNFVRTVLLADRDARVRAAALEALGRLESDLGDAGEEPDPEIVPALLGGLAAEDVFERAAAARALGRLRTGGRELRDAWRSDDAGEHDFRLAALRAVAAGESGGAGDGATDFVREALSDPAWPVRREAHEILRARGEAPGPPEPAPTLPLDAYRALLTAPFSPVAWITTTRGEIELELDVQEAPRTVGNFMKLARDGFFNGLSFHRVVPNFVVQAGDPRGDSSGGPGYSIRCEIGERSYRRGSVGMALDGKDTGGSQWFITLLPQPHLDGRYTLFGHVTAGLDVLDRLEPGDRIERVRIWDGVVPPESG